MASLGSLLGWVGLERGGGGDCVPRTCTGRLPEPFSHGADRMCVARKRTHGVFPRYSAPEEATPPAPLLHTGQEAVPKAEEKAVSLRGNLPDISIYPQCWGRGDVERAGNESHEHTEPSTSIPPSPHHSIICEGHGAKH